MRTSLNRFFIRFFFIGMLPFLLMACQIHLEPEELLMKSLSHHGGLTAMEAQQQLAFSKKTISYDSLGREISELRQQFFYDFETGKRGLQWQEGKDSWELSHSKDQYVLLKNGEISLLTEAQNKSYESLLNGGLYVYWQPYKLFKDISKKTYIGIENLLGSPVHVLEVTYDNSEDVWQYYFDVDSFRLLANRVLHSGRYSLVTNDNTESVSGFSLPSQRTSYRVDAQNKVLWKQAFYEYHLSNEPYNSK